MDHRRRLCSRPTGRRRARVGPMAEKSKRTFEEWSLKESDALKASSLLCWSRL